MHQIFHRIQRFIHIFIKQVHRPIIVDFYRFCVRIRYYRSI